MTQRTITIHGPVPGPRDIARVDEVMREASAQLGETWGCCRMDGAWVFNQGRAAGITSRRRFVSALADCLRVDVKIAEK